MSTAEILNKAVGDILIKMDTNVVYNHLGEFPKTIPAGVEYGEDQEGDTVFEVMDLTVKAPDVPDPAYRDTVTIDDDTWYRVDNSGDGPGLC